MIDVVHLVFSWQMVGQNANVIFGFKGHSHIRASSWIMFQSEQFWTDVFWNWHSKDVWLMYRSFHFWMTLLSVMQLWFAVNGGWQVYMRTFRSRSTLKVEKSVTIKVWKSPALYYIRVSRVLKNWSFGNSSNAFGIYISKSKRSPPVVLFYPDILTNSFHLCFEILSWS
jgi:hypothetical protein